MRPGADAAFEPVRAYVTIESMMLDCEVALRLRVFSQVASHVIADPTSVILNL